LNKLEAKFCLFVITFFTGIQYVFLTDIETGISEFAFLTITNFIGFVIVFAAFFGEVLVIVKRNILESLLLAALMFMFNICLLLGSSGMNPSVVSFAVTGYLIFIPVIYLLMKKKIPKEKLIGTAVVMTGLFIALEISPSNFGDYRLLFLLGADLFFALYIVAVEYVCKESNPSILAMGRMFFSFIISFVCWVTESAVTGRDMTLPTDASFWSSVMFISVFICGFYCVVQIYAQRFVSSMDTALIFSTETVVTLLMAPLLVTFTGGTAAPITVFKLVGCAVIIAGVLVADGSVFARLSPPKEGEKSKSI
jgi:drug/metabolite transporter (DMT)-like permease